MFGAHLAKYLVVLVWEEFFSLVSYKDLFWLFGEFEQHTGMWVVHFGGFDTKYHLMVEVSNLIGVLDYFPLEVDSAKIEIELGIFEAK